MVVIFYLRQKEYQQGTVSFWPLAVSPINKSSLAAYDFLPILRADEFLTLGVNQKPYAYEMRPAMYCLLLVDFIIHLHIVQHY
jgi:hypothetical protein